MSDDPLAAMLTRTLGEPVRDVRSEIVKRDARIELERVSFRVGEGSRSLVFTRLPKDRALEVQLLPFLARKTDRVPRVYARGIPPPLVPAWPWLLLEDLVAAADACDDREGIAEAKREVERAVAGDRPALRALGVPGDGTVLMHGDLRCANAKRTERGIVLTEWARAHLGEGGEQVLP
ncbi:MAG: hypothetical protein HY071_03025 [Chloroflexi bacterium]|nr:hypothetical protein [Chloroflexota bacterium]